MQLSDADRTEIREHIHAACTILDRDPALHHLEDPLLRVALHLTLAAARLPEQHIMQVAA